MNRHLYDCTTAVERLEWVKERLHCGHTVTEAGLSLGGVPNPIALISGLRATGIGIETITVDRVDHAGDRHTGCTAWRLMPSPMGWEAAKSARQHANATIKHHAVSELKTEA
jgi:hypothetical protein